MTRDVDILQFQAGREAAMGGLKRDGRKHRDWLAGYDQKSRAKKLVMSTDKPTAAPAYFPYKNHRTMAEIMEDEEKQREKARRYYRENFKSWRR